MLDHFRSSLTPRTIEALVCSQNWLRSKLLSSGNGHDSEMVDDVKSYELDSSFHYSLRNLFFYLQIPFIDLNCDCNYLFLFNSL